MRETDGSREGPRRQSWGGRRLGGGGRPRWAETQTKLRRGSQSGRDSEPGTQGLGRTEKQLKQ